VVPLARSGRRFAKHKRPSGGREDVIRLALVSVAAYGAGAFTGPLLAHALGANDRGNLASAIAPMSVLVSVGVFGLDTAAAYFAQNRPRSEVIESAWIWVLSCVLPVSVLVWIFSPNYLSGRPDSTINYVKYLAVLMPLLVLVQIAIEVELLRRGASIRMLVVQFGGLLLNALFVVVLAIAGRLSLDSSLGAAALSQTFSVIAGFTLLRIPIRVAFRRNTTLSMFKYASLAATGTVSFVLVGRLDQLVMVRLIPSAELGRYAVAANVVVISGAVSIALGRWGFAKVRSSSEPWVMFARLLKVVLAQSVVFAVFLAVVAPFAIPILFGQEFKGSVKLLLLLIPGQICLDVANVVCSGLSAKGRPGLTSAARLSGALVSVMFLYPAIRRFGAEGAAVVTSLSTFTLLVFAWTANRRVPWAVAA
jgi:O-antigen/teichoic acid export membrane protein